MCVVIPFEGFPEKIRKAQTVFADHAGVWVVSWQEAVVETPLLYRVRAELQGALGRLGGTRIQ